MIKKSSSWQLSPWASAWNIFDSSEAQESRLWAVTLSIKYDYLKQKPNAAQDTN